jgi:hypothetical protein
VNSNEILQEFNRWLEETAGSHANPQAWCDGWRRHVDRLADAYAAEGQTNPWSPEVAHECIQESAPRKAMWLAWARGYWPVGTRVKVVSDRSGEVPHYVGQYGKVTGYDIGQSGDWPLVSVLLDSGKQDSFQGDNQGDDEIQRISGDGRALPPEQQARYKATLFFEFDARFGQMELEQALEKALIDLPLSGNEVCRIDQDNNEIADR